MPKLTKLEYTGFKMVVISMCKDLKLNISVREDSNYQERDIIYNKE